jgi:hypothetical protein
MQESTGRESSTKQDDSKKDSEATSKETLSDLEENKKNVESGGSKQDPGPSPDGALDESDEFKDAGPM